jgi:hypothetical protein
MKEITFKVHDCKEKIVHERLAYGHAITDVTWTKDDGWCAENGEYCSKIRYCPWCGAKLDNL